MLIAMPGKRQPEQRARSHYLSSSSLQLMLLLLFAFRRRAKGGEVAGAGHKRRQGGKKNAPAIAAKMRETTARQAEQKGRPKQRHKKQRINGWGEEGVVVAGAQVEEAGRKNEMKFTFINHSCALQTERNEWEAGQVGEREKGRQGDGTQITFRSILVGSSPCKYVCVFLSPLSLSISSLLAMNVNSTHWHGAFGENAKML